MSRRPAVPAAAVALLLAGLVLPLLARASRADGAAPDTTVEGVVRAMADSTDRWFGIAAQAPDTTGLDSLRDWALSHPGMAPKRRMRVSLAPLFGFNRAIGGAMGAQASAGPSRGPGRASASAQWTTGAGTWFGEGTYTKRWMQPDEDVNGTVFEVRAGRRWDGLDRDYHEPLLVMSGAFLLGSDRSHYLRRDGTSLSLRRRGAAGWLGAGARDELESPLPTTATWTLFGRTPVVLRNDPAALVRVHEVDVQAGWRPQKVSLTVEGHVWTAGGTLGGDATYTRTRAAAGGAFALGRHFAFAPEVEYGRLTGDALPQEAFYLGGGTLRSLNALSLQGTGRALAHADLIVTDALQTILGMQRTPVFPVQVAAFAGGGAVWGTDPLTGRAAATRRDRPNRDEWLSEVGVSVMYRPGLPLPDAYARIDWAFPIGADGREPRLYVSYMRSLNFLRR